MNCNQCDDEGWVWAYSPTTGMRSRFKCNHDGTVFYPITGATLLKDAVILYDSETSRDGVTAGAKVAAQLREPPTKRVRHAKD